MTLTEPNYYSSADRALYDRLLINKRNGQKLTQVEQDFINKIYHQEEFSSGLDGEE